MAHMERTRCISTLYFALYGIQQHTCELNFDAMLGYVFFWAFCVELLLNERYVTTDLTHNVWSTSYPWLLARWRVRRKENDGVLWPSLQSTNRKTTYLPE